MTKHVLASLAALIFLSPVASASETVDRTVPAAPDGEVSISSFAGSLTVIGWDQPEVLVTGELIGDGIEELRVESDGDEVLVKLEVESRDHGVTIRGDDVGGRIVSDDFGRADLTVHVPRGSEIEVSAISAEIELRGLEGELEISSVSGEIVADRVPEDSEFSTVSGDIDLLDSRFVGGGEFSTVSGTIKVGGELDPSGDYEFSSVSGDVELALPGYFGGHFEVSSFSGRIESEFGGEPIRKSSHIPAEELEFDLPGGTADVDMSTVSGRLEIRLR